MDFYFLTMVILIDQGKHATIWLEFPSQRKLTYWTITLLDCSSVYNFMNQI